MGRSAQVKVVPVYSREALLAEFVPMIKVSVDKIQDTSRLPLDREDLLAAALTGFFVAVKYYDPTIDKSFRSFAERSIHKAILDEIRSTADFFQHVHLQPIGPAEAVRQHQKLAGGYDRKGHKYRVH